MYSNLKQCTVLHCTITLKYEFWNTLHRSIDAPLTVVCIVTILLQNSLLYGISYHSTVLYIAQLHHLLMYILLYNTVLWKRSVLKYKWSTLIYYNSALHTTMWSVQSNYSSVIQLAVQYSTVHFSTVHICILQYSTQLCTS